MTETPACVLVCGTGTRFGQMTLETSALLKRCDRILCVNLDGETLARVCDVFPAAAECRLSGAPEVAIAPALAGALDSGAKTVAVLLMGHPLVYSIGGAVADFCRVRGIGYQILPALSAADAVLAALEPRLESGALARLERGMSLLSAPDVARDQTELDPSRSILMLNLFRMNEQFADKSIAWSRLQAHLLRFYSAEHPIALVECAADPAHADRCVRGTVSQLVELASSAGSGATLFVPAHGEDPR